MSWVDLTFTGLSLGEFGDDWQLGQGKVNDLPLGGDSGLHPGSAWSPRPAREELKCGSRGENANISEFVFNSTKI